MYLVMLETNGNQPFIFSSPRLRENIGASYQLTRLKEWTQEVLRISEESPQWVSRSSGKVIVRTDSEEEASELIRCVTATAAAQAPGLDELGSTWIWGRLESSQRLTSKRFISSLPNMR
ncbi:hypothetical protein [Schaalia cardiffensis]|uniref:hypothetical protein n=1 Tax=Schaalia cardiffensis TaxID=181487 RepID=UPI0023F094FA|nr:hypothetical protein [Schaalia cardiffensis]